LHCVLISFSHSKLLQAHPTVFLDVEHCYSPIGSQRKLISATILLRHKIHDTDCIRHQIPGEFLWPDGIPFYIMLCSVCVSSMVPYSYWIGPLLSTIRMHQYELMERSQPVNTFLSHVNRTRHIVPTFSTLKELLCMSTKMYGSCPLTSALALHVIYKCMAAVSDWPCTSLTSALALLVNFMYTSAGSCQNGSCTLCSCSVSSKLQKQQSGWDHWTVCTSTVCSGLMWLPVVSVVSQYWWSSDISSCRWLP